MKNTNGPLRLPARRRVLAGQGPRCPECHRALPNVRAECTATKACRALVAAADAAWARWNELLDQQPRRWRDLFRRRSGEAVGQ